jgi:hypothetical protein
MLVIADTSGYSKWRNCREKWFLILVHVRSEGMDKKACTIPAFSSVYGTLSTQGNLKCRAGRMEF